MYYKQAVKMIELILEAMKDTIKEADWMSDETKQQALEKVKNSIDCHLFARNFKTPDKL